jgi:PhzF family phenazine biosynthesis protein
MRRPTLAARKAAASRRARSYERPRLARPPEASSIPALDIVQTVVFAKAPGGGNPCPVVLHADALTSAQMQSVAAYFNQETAFVLRATGADVRLRYFVPRHEMEMCVHGTVGAITTLVRRGVVRVTPVRVDTPVGVIDAEWDDGSAGLVVWVSQLAPRFGPIVRDVSPVVAALGIREIDIDGGAGPVRSVSTSRSKLLIPLRDASVLDNLNPDLEALWTLCDWIGTTGLYPFTLRPRDRDVDAEARQFPCRAGYAEDPATGVATAALAAYLAHHATAATANVSRPGRIRVGQGRAMGRPSVMEAEAVVVAKRVVGARVGGTATVVGEEATRPVP